MRNLDSIFDGAERSAPNPFRDDVFASGISPIPGVMEVHADALSRCLRAFESLFADRGSQAAPSGGTGRTLLLAAPRAGFGKSHLVGRVRAVTESLIAPIALPFDPARPVSWETMLVSIFNQYRSSRCPQHLACNLFEETVRYFQSQSVRFAMERGLVDEKELPETEIALRLQYREVFDPKSGNKMVSWLTKRSPEIMDSVAAALGQRWGLEFDDIVFWNRFFQDAVRPKSTAFEQFRTLSVAGARDRLTQFLRIASDCRPVAFVADHLDGFFGSETAGMRIAEILTDLRFAVPRSVTLLCLNEDVWNSIFERNIPTAWIDRLTGEATALRDISPENAEAILRNRLAAAGWPGSDSDSWLRHHLESCLETGGDTGLYPRELLRRAAREWEHDPLVRTPEGTPGASPVPPSPRPTPIEQHPLDSVASMFGNAPGRPAPPAKSEGNVFSAADEIPPAPVPPQATRPTTPPFASPFQPPKPAPSRAQQGPPPAMPPGPDPDRRPPARVDDPSAAARAAGIDPSRGLTNIDAIIAEIRGAGSKSISETSTPQTSPVMPASQSQPGIGGPPLPVPPPEGSDMERRLRELEAETHAAASAKALEWQPLRLEQLIRTIGRQFAAVAQSMETIENRPCLIWTVRGIPIRIGFEAPEHFSYWSVVLDRTKKSGTSKMVLFSHSSAPFGSEAMEAMGADRETASRHLDIIEMNQGDLALLYASERLLSEAHQRGVLDRAIRLVAKRLDPFWRRLARPMTGAGAAG
ncbi:MAG: hypothetical protein KDM64_01800 [Verrucomicrobiae bacterium]|nr:hypothetical protein [Verrucomicrobiae bacterium]